MESKCLLLQLLTLTILATLVATLATIADTLTTTVIITVLKLSAAALLPHLSGVAPYGVLVMLLLFVVS